MSEIKQRIKLTVCVLVTTSLLIVNFGSPAAIAEDLGNEAQGAPDIFSKVMSDLEQIKEMAFTQPFFDDAEYKSCDGTTKVCPHLAHPKTAIKRTAQSCTTSDPARPLAYSDHVRGTDIIPSVPNIEDYATPDEFVDEDMIHKLQSDDFSMDGGIEDYCNQMSKLLSDTLSSDSLSGHEKTAAIESAMKLAVINAQIAAEAKIVQIKANHESELAILRGRLMQYSYIESNQRKLFQWLSPIYSNVNRNFQQIEKMSDSSTQLKRCLDIIQAQFQHEQSVNGKNQLVVTKRDQTTGQPTMVKSNVQKVSNQFVRRETEEAGDDRITPVDFQILERRLQKAERLIDALTSYSSVSNAYSLEAEAHHSKSQNEAPDENPTHRRVSYDRLLPINPLQPRR